MAEQQEEVEGLYVQHQYMCSECHHLFNTLEEVLVHQQSHTGWEGEEGEVAVGSGDDAGFQQEGSQYHCLECGSLLSNSEELLLHQELHMREAGQGLCEVVESGEAVVMPPMASQIQYQCLECLALFDSPEVWLAHRQTHSKNATPGTATEMEYVLQADDTVTPLVNVQNLVLSEQRAEEILSLAQVLAAQQLPTTTTKGSLLPSLTTMPGSATLQLQICTAQALADGSLGSTRSKPMPSLLPSCSPLDLGGGKKAGEGVPSILTAESKQSDEGSVLIIHPYECSECALVFHTPEDFLQHQGEHFLCQDKESGEECVMRGEEESRSGEDGVLKVLHENTCPMERPQSHPSLTLGLTPPANLPCRECARTFTSANRLAAHQRVHEHGTHECPECDKVFKKPASLQTHMRTHSGEARYLCVDCGHGFATEMTLIIHRKSHTAEPLHRCQFCAKTFTNMTKFLYHRRTHAVRSPAAPVTVGPGTTRWPALSLLSRSRETQQGSASERNATHSPSPTVPSTDVNNCQRSSLQQNSGSQLPLNGVDTEGRPQAPDVALGSQFPCTSCSKSFPSQLQMVRHRRTVHVAERRFKCAMCSKSFKKQVHLRNHLRTHTGERPFQCSDCGKTFSSLANLSRHGLTHTGLRPYRCDVCHKAFTQSSNLRYHRMLHSTPVPLSCPECPATFLRAAKLAAHRFSQHPGAPAPFSCPSCPAGFLRKSQLVNHCLETHPAGSPSEAQECVDPGVTIEAETGALQRLGLDCTVCGKRLNSAANLRLHRLLHSSAHRRATTARRKAHQCPICGKLFVSTSGLSLHQRVHTGERPFPCLHCGKRFRQNTHLREHLRTHSGERPFRCELCDKSFVQSMHLVEHRRTHTDERPHLCLICGKAFRTFSNLRNHRKTHGRGLPESGASSAVELSPVVQSISQQGELIQIQTQLQQSQSTPTIMCNEFGETIAIIETSEGEALPLADAIEIYQTALENSLGTMDSITVDGMQLM